MEPLSLQQSIVFQKHEIIKSNPWPAVSQHHDTQTNVESPVLWTGRKTRMC